MNASTRILEVIDATLSHAEPPPVELPSTDVEETVRALVSDDARARLAADPYWPKWDSPWWRITLMEELGLAALVPPAAAQALLAAVKTHYHREFPFRVEDVPAGVDPYRGILCHCALGTLDRVATSCGLNVDAEMPWVRGWYVKYAMPDGGFNCDEAAYLRPTPRSSFLSTLPVLEVLLDRTEHSGEEAAVLDRGAKYLLDRHLCRSISKNQIADPSFLQPTFPRFYDYDVLRGLAFVVRWARRRGAKLPAAGLVEAVDVLACAAGPDGALAPQRQDWRKARTMEPGEPEWTRGHPARLFPLLESAGRTDRPSQALTRSWRGTLESLRSVLGA